MSTSKGKPRKPQTALSQFSSRLSNKQTIITPESQHLQKLFMQAPAFICVLRGKDHIYELSNELHYQLVGFRDILGKPIREALPGMVDQGIIKLLDNVLKTGKPFIGNEMKVQLQRQENGLLEHRYLNFIYPPIQEDNGSYSGIFVHGFDVTDQVIARQKVEESEEQFKTFADNIQNLAWMANPDGFIYWYNRQWYDYTGTNFEEMHGWGWERVHHPDQIKRVVNFVKKAWSKGETWELTFPLKGADGHYRWYLTRAYAVKDTKGKVVRWIGTNTNIDEQKKAEEAVVESEELFRTLADQSPMAVFMSNEDGHVKYWNKYWLEFTRHTIEKALGLSWKDVTHPDDVENLLRTYLDATKVRQNYTVEARMRRWDGGYRTVLFAGGPRYLTNGTYAGYIGVGVDITERKALERQKDDFIGITTHELKTPVTSIKAFAQVLQNRFAKSGDEKSAVLLQKMDAQLNKLNDLIADLLDTTKFDTGQLQFRDEYFDFNELVIEIIEELQRTTEKHQIIMQLNIRHIQRRLLFVPMLLTIT